MIGDQGEKINARTSFVVECQTIFAEGDRVQGYRSIRKINPSQARISSISDSGTQVKFRRNLVEFRAFKHWQSVNHAISNYTINPEN